MLDCLVSVVCLSTYCTSTALYFFSNYILNWLLAVGLHHSNQAQACYLIWLAIEEMKGSSVPRWLKILTMLGYLDIVKSQLTKEERIGCQQRSTSGRDYAGEANTTKDGLPCQKWSETKPHDHSFTHVGDHNFCRNPNGVPAPEAWCYTIDPEVRETPLQKTPWKFLGIACFFCWWGVGGRGEKGPSRNSFKDLVWIYHYPAIKSN